MKKKLGGAVLILLIAAAATLTAASADPQGAKPATLGQAMPDFKLSSVQGGEVTLSALAGKNVLLIFPRGLAGEKHWCHVCNYQYADLAELEKATGFRKSKNLEVLFVMPYGKTMVAEWVDKFADQMKDIEAWKNPPEVNKLDEKGKARLDLMRKSFPQKYLYEKGRVPLPFPVLIDEGAKIAKSLGIFTGEWSGSKIDQNVPTIFILDPKGIVRFKYISQNTFDRPSAEYLLKFIEFIGK
jgi:peroxiredoxin